LSSVALHRIDLIGKPDEEFIASLCGDGALLACARRSATTLAAWVRYGDSQQRSKVERQRAPIRNWARRSINRAHNEASDHAHAGRALNRPRALVTRKRRGVRIQEGKTAWRPRKGPPGCFCFAWFGIADGTRALARSHALGATAGLFGIGCHCWLVQQCLRASTCPTPPGATAGLSSSVFSRRHAQDVGRPRPSLCSGTCHPSFMWRPIISGGS
jgi:hypothetical protein